MNIKVLTFVGLILMLFTLGNRDVYDANGSLSRDVVGSLDIRNKTSNPYTASSPVIVEHLALLDYKIPSEVSTPVKNTSNPYTASSPVIVEHLALLDYKIPSEVSKPVKNTSNIKKLENDFINEIRFVDIVNSPLETNLGVLLSDLEVTSLLELEVNALPSNHVYSYKVDNEPEIPDEVISRLLEDISNPHAFIHDDLKHLEIILSEDKVIDLMKEEVLLQE